MFFSRSWKIGKIIGIPIGIDPSWVLVFVLLTYQLATIVLPAELGLGWRRGLRVELVALAAVASLLLFASVIAHELAHAYMAQQRGVPVLGITLFIFGGVAQIADEPDTPATEFLIAVMGPLMSLALGVCAAAIWIWLQALLALTAGWRALLLPPTVIAFYLAQANLMLAAFNLLPGFPLDGGRVVRALLWKWFGSLRRATYWAMLTGRGIAFVLAVTGLLLLLRREFGGGWLVLIAWFIWRAASDAYHAVLARELLKQVTVGQLMRAPLARVSEAWSLKQLNESEALLRQTPLLAVDADGRAVGLVGMDRLQRVKREDWESIRVRDMMRPFAPGLTVSPQQQALKALQMILQQETEDLAVVSQGEVIGSIGREDLAKYLDKRGV